MDLQLPANPEILRQVAFLDHCRGAWRNPPLPEDRRRSIERASLLRSVAASCRMAGIRIQEDAVAEVLTGSDPDQHAAQILGYARALRAPFLEADRLLEPETIARLNAVVLGADGDRPEPSPWRREAFHHEAFDHSGRATGRIFQTLPPRLLPRTMDDLASWFELEMRGGEHHALLIIGAFTLALVSALPFAHGNARTARVLSFHLIRRAGYSYLPLASLDRILESMREEYHEALAGSETRLWSGCADLVPWMQFFLRALRRHADRVSAKLALEGRALEFSSLQRSILDTVREHGTAGAGLLMSATGANRNTLKDNLRRLVERGLLERTGSRRGTRYRLHGIFPSDV